MSNKEWKSPAMDLRMEDEDGDPLGAQRPSTGRTWHRRGVAERDGQGADKGEHDNPDQRLPQAGMTRGDLGRERSSRPRHEPKVKVNGIEK